MLHHAGRFVATVALYVALVVWLTWPLARNVSTHLPATILPCDFDLLYMGSILAHESRALAAWGKGFTDFPIFHPARGALFYGDTGFGALPYFMPVFLASGNPTLALNLLFIGCVALSAAALHEVARCWTGLWLAGLVAGVTFLTTRWVLWNFIPGAPSYSVLQYFPFVIALSAAPPRSASAALLLASLIVVQCLTDVVYVAGAVLTPLLLLSLVRLARRSTRASGGWTLAAVGVAALLLSPIYVQHVRARAALGSGASTAWTLAMIPYFDRLPSDLRGLLAPTAIPAAALVLIAVGTGVQLLSRSRSLYRRVWLNAAFWAVVGCYISLKPVVYLGRIRFALPPQQLLANLTFYSVVRVPMRLGVASLMGLALLAALAFAACTNAIEQRLRSPSTARAASGMLALATLAAMYASYDTGILNSSPHDKKALPPVYPLAEAINSDSPLMQILGRTRGPLLEVPASDRGPMQLGENARAMYRAIFHRHPVLNGYSSYAPDTFPTTIALAARLPDAAALQGLVEHTGLEYILVHLDELQGNRGSAWRLTAKERARTDLWPVVRWGGDLLFAVAQPPAAELAPAGGRDDGQAP